MSPPTPGGQDADVAPAVLEASDDTHYVISDDHTENYEITQTLSDDQVHIYDLHEEDVHDVRGIQTPGVDNPGFVPVIDDTNRTIQTRDLPPGIVSTNQALTHSTGSLPDILNAHLPPPYEAVVIENQERRHRRRQRRHEDCEKNCCKRFMTSLTRFKWILCAMSALGISCTLAGVVLGALHMTGSSFLTLALMFIGLGVMLIVVVLIGWRCTPRGHEPCHLLLNLGQYSTSRRRHSSTTSTSSRSSRQLAVEGYQRQYRVGREPGRRTYWSGGVIYGEHQHRQPPPSYAAAMQDYERQLMSRMNNVQNLPNSPPPTYKSQASLQRPGLRAVFINNAGDAISGPPTYRSQAGTLLRPSLLQVAAMHERNDLDRGSDNPVQVSNVNITVHRGMDDTVSAISTDDNTFSAYYGTMERSAVQCLENSIRTADDGYHGNGDHSNVNHSDNGRISEELPADDLVNGNSGHDDLVINVDSTSNGNTETGARDNLSFSPDDEDNDDDDHNNRNDQNRTPNTTTERNNTRNLDNSAARFSPDGYVESLRQSARSARFTPRRSNTIHGASSRSANANRANRTILDDSGYSGSALSPRYGSARTMTSQTARHFVGYISHIRSSSAGGLERSRDLGVTEQWPGHVATLV